MHLLAALLFFTRLPLWRWIKIPSSAFRRVIAYWPLTGWLTALLTAGVYFALAQFIPEYSALVIALIVRMLFTGALHEDGLADFFDGMGGGTDRTRRLAIMKDSQIGTYGVLALLSYCGAWVALLGALPQSVAVLAILCGDPLAKGFAAQLPNLLPYARAQQQSKSGTTYLRMSVWEGVMCVGAALLPLLVLVPLFCPALLPMGLLMWALTNTLKRKIGGYTGDCCGACALLLELCFYLCGVLTLYLL